MPALSLNRHPHSSATQGVREAVALRRVELPPRSGRRGLIEQTDSLVDSKEYNSTAQHSTCTPLCSSSIVSQLAAANTTLTPAWQPWAGQLAAAMAAVGQPLDLTTPMPIPLAALATASQQRQLQ